MDPVRGHCNGTRYVVRQISRWYIGSGAVHSAHTAVDAYVFTHRRRPSCTWRRRDVRKAFAFSVNNFQTVSVVIKLSFVMTVIFLHVTVYIFRCMTYFCLCIIINVYT